MNPRMPNSPPAVPTITLSLITSGADVIEYPAVASATILFHSGRPLRASMAIRWASMLARNSVSP